MKKPTKKTTAKQRVQIELDELQEKLDKLSTYITENDETNHLLLNQKDVMNTYVNILIRRLATWEEE